MNAILTRLLTAGLTLATFGWAQQWQARHGLTPTDYQTTFNNLVSQGYRLTSVSGYASGGAERYAALFTKAGGGAWVARHAMSATDYQAYFNYYVSLGYRLTWISGYEVNGVERYAAIWEQKSGGPWIARHGMTATDYQKAFDTYTQQGYRLIHVAAYAIAGTSRYAAIFEQKSGPAWIAKHGMTSAAYQQEFQNLAAQGFQVREVAGHNVGGVDYYAAIWESSSGGTWSARHGIPDSWYQNVFDNYYYQSYSPQYISAFASGSGARLNCVWTNTQFTTQDLAKISQKVNTYKSANNLPGLAVAITKDDRLIYAAGFGTADPATGEEVGPANLFRIASVSKPVTATAIIRLTHTHGLSLDDRVFGPGGILGSRFPTPAGNERINQITVRHLLQHTSGFTNTPSDPMFENTSYSQDQLISWVLNSSDRFVKRTPGTVYEYLNFGFCLLGRVIEQKSGMTYEQYVKQYVLTPSGETSMQIAGNSLAERKPREVTYSPSSAYDLNVRRFDSHGGWLASPIGLTRFLAYVDGLVHRTDIVLAGDRTTMITAADILDATRSNPNYGMGWVNNPQSHDGAMNGSGAVLGLFTNGYSVAVISNARPSSDTFAWGMLTMGSDIINAIGNWPGYDLF